MTSPPNLLPESVVHQRFLASRLKRWSIVCLIVFLTTVFICVWHLQVLTDLEWTAARLAAKSGPLRGLVAEQQQMTHDIEAMRERESWLTDSDSSQVLQLLGIISSATQKNNGRISVQTLNMTSIDRPVTRSPDDDDDDAQEQRIQLDLNGIAVNDLAVASFVAFLRESDVFESVELKSSVSQIFDNHETRGYEVTCIY